MSHSQLTVVISILSMLVFFMAVFAIEWKSSKRSKAFASRTNQQISNLAQKVQERYRRRYGKNPTMELPILHVVKIPQSTQHK